MQNFLYITLGAIWIYKWNLIYCLIKLIFKWNSIPKKKKKIKGREKKNKEGKREREK